MAALTVVLTGLTAAELGARRRGQVIAALCCAVAVFVLTVGHLLSTTTFDLLAWAALTYVIARAVRTGDDRLWLVAGVVLGLALLNKPLAAFLAVALLIGAAVAGPRRLFGNPWVWAGAFIALLLWAPWLLWQDRHDWPQLDVAESIQGGGSTSSEPRWAFLPFQFLLVSPLLAPVWIAGLVRLFRDESLRPFRFLGWTWVVLAAIFIVTGGKPYYIAGLFPLLLAAGGGAVDDWLARGTGRLRMGVLGAAIAVSAVISALIALPLLPRDSTEPVLAANEDIGETIGWPSFVQTVADVSESIAGSDRVVVFTENYGQAGAIDRYRGEINAPDATSGHNGYWYWGPPPDFRGGPFVVVGFGEGDLPRAFAGCVVEARVRNPYGVDNDENGTPVWICEELRDGAVWSQVWPSLQRLG
jgi:4-amino-4-deoxy-L-arabinose transferase-like glycosyltransferase